MKSRSEPREESALPRREVLRDYQLDSRVLFLSAIVIMVVASSLVELQGRAGNRGNVALAVSLRSLGGIEGSHGDVNLEFTSLAPCNPVQWSTIACDREGQRLRKVCTYDGRELRGGGDEDLARRNLQAKNGDRHKGGHCEDWVVLCAGVSKSLDFKEN